MCAERTAGRAAISDAEAKQIAEVALMTLNEGDYEAFVANFAKKLSEAMTEAKFLELQETMQETSGKYLSLAGQKLAKAPTPEAVGYVSPENLRRKKSF